MGIFALFRKNDGSVAIETAFVVPMLAVMSLGGFEASQIISRQTEMQSAMAEASAIVLAASPETASERDTIEDVIESSTGLSDNQVTLSLTYRCGTETGTENSKVTCYGEDATDDNDEDEGGYSEEEISTFIRIRIQNTYTPQWVSFGIGKPVQYDVERTVQIG